MTTASRSPSTVSSSPISLACMLSSVSTPFPLDQFEEFVRVAPLRRVHVVAAARPCRRTTGAPPGLHDPIVGFLLLLALALTVAATLVPVTVADPQATLLNLGCSYYNAMPTAAFLTALNSTFVTFAATSPPAAEMAAASPPQRSHALRPPRSRRQMMKLEALEDSAGNHVRPQEMHTEMVQQGEHYMLNLQPGVLPKLCPLSNQMLFRCYGHGSEGRLCGWCTVTSGASSRLTKKHWQRSPGPLPFLFGSSSSSSACSPAPTKNALSTCLTDV